MHCLFVSGPILMHNKAKIVNSGYLNSVTTRVAVGVTMREHTEVGITGGFPVLPTQCPF